ncbi:hypothetical protein HPG69_004682 [Diceros bicornis minor]|uniref:Uncharacterized protein n=1 Tax=Diceros bicornis minor TaxID=77932 RepID=A0A7J7E4Q5_DICBM|nr:hypothetical protein HPG69_004682 [Diceros bicornis minor]
MIPLPWFHQSSFLLPASKKKRVSKQCKLMRLPFASFAIDSREEGGTKNHSDQSSKSSLVSEIRNVQSISHRKEKPSPSIVTERKKCISSWESNNPADTPCVIDLD